MSAPGWMDPVGLWALPVSRREGRQPLPPQAHSRRRHTSAPALGGAKGWAWAHHLRCHIWKEPGQPHWQPPACLGLPKSAERVKVLTGLILSGQTAVVMWGWAVCAATHHKEERREKKREKKMLDIYGSRSQREGILRVGWQFVVLIALSNSC